MVAVAGVIVSVIIASNIEAKPDIQNLQSSQDLQKTEKKPDTKESVQKQLGLLDESGREMFTPGPSVKSQLGLP